MKINTKINTERLVLVFIIALLIVNIVALIFYYTGREDIAKEIVRALEMFFTIVFLPVAMIILKSRVKKK